MLDGGANVCCIGGADMSIVFKPGRLENSIKVEGIHGTPKESKVIRVNYSSNNSYGSIIADCNILLELLFTL